MAGNASNSAKFRKDDGAAQQKTQRQRPRVTVELVSRGETKTRDPFRDAPMLMPAFVTQVLGQVMHQEQKRLLRSGYGMPTEKSARLFDTRF